MKNDFDSADFRQVFEQSPGLYLILSPDLYIIDATDLYLEATLTRREEITGKFLFDVFPDNPGDPDTKAVDTMSASIKRVFKTKSADAWAIQRHDVRIDESEGGGFKEKYWRPVNTPLLDEWGEIKYILHSVDDVTEYVTLQKKGEVDYDKHLRHLESVNQKLAATNQEMEQLVYAASHDLQEPLRTITNYIGLLKEGYTDLNDENVDKYLHFINRSVGKMQNLIKDLLDYSRIGRNFNITIVDTRKLLEDVVNELEASITENNARIIFNGLPTIKGDETKLRQLFQNLISNAIKFRRKDREPVISVTADEQEGLYLFSVKDNGIGIDEKYIPKLFVVFQRLHSEKEYKGTGIGLATCKKIVTLHNGKIWVESTAGEGSSFNFIIPKELKAS